MAADFTQKIFSGDVNPTNIVSQFGSLAYGDPNYSDDPDVIQNLNAWLLGWEAALIDGKYPTIQDMNAVFYVISRQLAYLQQAGIPEWKTDIEYFTGSIARDSVGRLYKSLTDNNLGNALTDAANWFLYHSPVIYEMTANYTLTNQDSIIRFSATDPLATRYVILPTPAARYTGRRVKVYNQTSTYGIAVIISALGSGITFNTTASTSGVTVLCNHATYPKYAEFVCDGSNWWCVTNNQEFAL